MNDEERNPEAVPEKAWAVRVLPPEVLEALAAEVKCDAAALERVLQRFRGAFQSPEACVLEALRGALKPEFAWLVADLDHDAIWADFRRVAIIIHHQGRWYVFDDSGTWPRREADG